jgi:predicted membrane protein|tara:strand:- start:4628 stop:4972 length:345 start_codon:yes stop_codon:yes gene_type:complete
MNMSFKKLFNYMVWVFISCLGLFNSTKLEERYAEGSNQELFFQNGIIISSAFIGLFLAAFFVELLIMKKRPVSSVPSGKKNKKKVDTKKLDKTEKDSTKDVGLAIEKEKDVKSD